MGRKKFLVILELLVMTLFLTACPADLGYANNQEYYDAFMVDFIDENGNRVFGGDGETIESFYDKESVNNFKTAVDDAKYKYMIIIPTEDVTISEFYFYCKSDCEEKVTFNMYVSDTLPSKIADLKDIIAKIHAFIEYLKKKAKGEDASFEELESDEKSSGYLASCGRTFSTWKDTGFNSYTVNGETSETFSAKAGQYIIVQVENNTGAGIKFNKDTTEEEAEELEKEAEEKLKGTCTLNITNIMIRVEK